jgi:hypothetical protein
MSLVFNLKEQKMNKAKLIQKIQKAIEPRMEPRGYGDNPEEMQETKSDTLYLTQDEVLCVIGMRKCTSVAISTNLGGYDESCFGEDGKAERVFTSSNRVHVRLGKKVAKAMIKDIYSPKLISVHAIGSVLSDDNDRFSIVL